MTDLLPCPFCGGDPVVIEVGKERFRIECGKCGASANENATATVGISMVRWNSRKLTDCLAQLQLMPQLVEVTIKRLETLADTALDGRLYEQECKEQMRMACMLLHQAYSSDGRTDEAKAREASAGVADGELQTGFRAGRRYGSPPSNDHQSEPQAGVGSERSSPSETYEHSGQKNEFSLRWAVDTVLQTFRDDEAAGYRSRDRQYAISILGKAVEMNQTDVPSPGGMAAADVLERIAAERCSDPATDDLTVPLAIQLAEVEGERNLLRRQVETMRKALKQFEVTCSHWDVPGLVMSVDLTAIRPVFVSMSSTEGN